jgi:Fic family protein
MFPFTLTSQTEADIDSFRLVAKRLDVNSILPRTWSGRVRRDLQAAAISASVGLEGVPVTADEVRRILAEDRPPAVSEEDAALVSGYKEAMQFVLSRADDPAFVWSAEIVRNIHASVSARSWSLRAGLYRDRQVWLTNAQTGEQIYLPPETDRVPSLVDELAEWLQGPATALPALAQAALAHVWLAAVHPFRDGNGRTARILASLVMYRNGFRLPQFTSLEEWWGSHPADYYAAFECLGTHWDPTADVTPFVSAHVRAQRLQADALLLKETTERLLWSAMEDIAVHELHMDPRAANALWDAFFGRQITNRYYRGVADLQQVTASHDLKQLQTSGLLEPHGEGRSRSYTGTIRLVRRVVDLFDLPIDATGDGPVDSDLRTSTLAALAAKALAE